MALNLELFLVAATLFTGLSVVLYRLGRRREHPSGPIPWLIDVCRSFFPILLFVLLFRSFLFEPFRIPSGSMLPTLQIGDFILVNKFSYGLRLPVIHMRFLNVGDPERGDVVVFRFPDDPSQNFIKRLIGLPGDRITYRDKQLKVNDNLVYVGSAGRDRGSDLVLGSSDLSRERLDDAEYVIMVHRGSPAPEGSWEVPPGSYFVMGDNRDNSNDSRVWGVVPEGNLVGRASVVWMHWNWDEGLDLSRVGVRI